MWEAAESRLTQLHEGRRHPRLGLVAGSRGPTQIHIRGLCHWAGEPAGHLGRAGLETFGLVHDEHNLVTRRARCASIRIWWKKAALRPWVVAPLTMAAAPAEFAGGDFGCVAALSTRTTTAEVSAGHRFPRSL